MRSGRDSLSRSATEEALPRKSSERLLQERMDAAEHKKLVDRFLDELQSREAE